ncbi:DUF4235 domain-containing protein [Angustibacter aerolatus]
MGSFVWKLLGTGGAIAAGIGARKVLNTGWEKATGNPPPVNPASPNVQVLEAVAWAAVSGAIIQLARMAWTRKAAEYYRHSSGHLPPDMEEVS